MGIVRAEDRLVLIRRIRDGDIKAEREFCRAYGFREHDVSGKYFRCSDHEDGFLEIDRFYFYPRDMEVSGELDEAEVSGHVLFSISPDEVVPITSSCVSMKRLDGMIVPYCEVEVETKSEEEAEKYCRTFDFRWYDMKGRCVVDEEDPKKVRVYLTGGPGDLLDLFNNAVELYAADHYWNISGGHMDERIDEWFEEAVRDYINFGRKDKIKFKEGENELSAYVTNYSCDIPDVRNGSFSCEGGAKVLFRTKDPNLLIEDLNAFFE